MKNTEFINEKNQNTTDVVEEHDKEANVVSKSSAIAEAGSIEENNCQGISSEISTEVVDIEIHENVRHEFAAAFNALKAGDFNETIRLSYEILEWMPNCAQVFWMRLLAFNRCKSDEELIRHGCKTTEEGDFLNAMECGSKSEKKRFSDVKAKIEVVKKALCKRIDKEKHEKLLETKIIDVRSSLNKEVMESRDRMYELWEEAQKAEAQMYTLKEQCELISLEYRNGLEEAEKQAKSLKDRIYKVERCTDDEKNTYKMKLQDIESRSTQVLKNYKEIQNRNAQVKKFKKLEKSRNELFAKIDVEFEKLNEYEQLVEKVLNVAQKIESDHNEAYRSVSEYCFEQAINVLGEQIFNDIVEQSSIRGAWEGSEG